MHTVRVWNYFTLRCQHGGLYVLLGLGGAGMLDYDECGRWAVDTGQSQDNDPLVKNG